MIQLVITKTAKGYHKTSLWETFDHETHTFTDKKEAMDWIKDRYPNKKRQGMYRDTKAGTKRVGYVIGFRNCSWGNGRKDHYLQQDWIEFQEVRSITP